MDHLVFWLKSSHSCWPCWHTILWVPTTGFKTPKLKDEEEVPYNLMFGINNPMGKVCQMGTLLFNMILLLLGKACLSRIPTRVQLPSFAPHVDLKFEWQKFLMSNCGTYGKGELRMIVGPVNRVASKDKLPVDDHHIYAPASFVWKRVEPQKANHRRIKILLV